MLKYCTFIILSLSMTNYVTYVLSSDADTTVVLQSPQAVYKMRCSRRYTPGICTSQMSVVWTYVFQIQNCTERLGCPPSSRSNRFATYRRCARACSSLSALYAQVITVEGNNVSYPPQMSYRREFEPVGEGEENSNEQVEYKENIVEPPQLSPAEVSDDDAEQTDDVITLDIDYDGADHVPDPENWVHEVFGREYVT